MDKIAI